MASKQGGFTVVELMIAISVFAAAITIVMVGTVAVSRQFRQGTTRVQIEDASRELHQEIAQSIQFNGSVPIESIGGGYRAYCFGDKRYIFKDTSAPYDASRYTASSYNTLAGSSIGLVYSELGSGQNCNTNTPTAGRSLLAAGTHVLAFYFDGLNLTTKFVYADDASLLTLDSTDKLFSDIYCKTGIAGKEFCAQVPLTSTISRRTN